jgi:zinc protease
MGQGSPNEPVEPKVFLGQRGGRSPYWALTTQDITHYFATIPSNQLETALWLESDRMSHLLEMLNQQSLTNQIDVVRNERRQRIDNVPYGPSSLKLSELMYPEGHPYRYQTIGRHEDLEGASIDDVRDFYKTWYVPANATITIAGDFDTDQTKALVTKWFASFPKSERPKVVPVPAPVVAAQRVEISDRFAKLRQVTFAWHSPAAFAAGDADLELAASVLGGGDASRLNKILVVDRPLAQSVRASQGSQQFSGVFSVTVTLRSDADLATFEQLVHDEIARLAAEPVTDRELDRAVVRQEADVVYRLENLLSRGERLQTYNHYLGDPDKLSWDLDRYRQATPASLRDFAKQYLSAAHEVELVTLPTSAAATGGAQ